MWPAAIWEVSGNERPSLLPLSDAWAQETAANMIYVQQHLYLNTHLCFFCVSAAPTLFGVFVLLVCAVRCVHSPQKKMTVTMSMCVRNANETGDWTVLERLMLSTELLWSSSEKKTNERPTRVLRVCSTFIVRACDLYTCNNRLLCNSDYSVWPCLCEEGKEF